MTLRPSRSSPFRSGTEGPSGLRPFGSGTKGPSGRWGRWGVVAVLVMSACSSDASIDTTAAPATIEESAVDTQVIDDFVTVTVEGSVPEDSAPENSIPTVTHEEVRTQEGDGDVEPDGFTTVTARVTSADGDVCDVCLWLADGADERSRGLMGVSDLGDPVGMAFVWEAPTSGRFFMLNTPTPLSIAWFAADGSHVNEDDMEPCITDDSSTCERFESGGDYTVAIEMFQGELGVIGIGPGSSIELLDGTESPTCLVAR